MTEPVSTDADGRPLSDRHDREHAALVGEVEVDQRCTSVPAAFLDAGVRGQVADQADEFRVRTGDRWQPGAAAVGPADEHSVTVDVDVLDGGVGQQRFEAAESEYLGEHLGDDALFVLGRQDRCTARQLRGGVRLGEVDQHGQGERLPRVRTQRRRAGVLVRAQLSGERGPQALPEPGAQRLGS